MKVGGGGHYSRAVNDGARTVSEYICKRRMSRFDNDFYPIWKYAF